MNVRVSVSVSPAAEVMVLSNDRWLFTTPSGKRTGVRAYQRSQLGPLTRPRLDLDPDMTRPDPGRDPKSSTDFADLEVDPQISPAQDPNPRAPSRHQISLEI